MKSKTFDCVEMKRRGAELVQKQLEGKSRAQQLEYWQKGTDELKKLQEQKKGKLWKLLLQDTNVFQEMDICFPFHFPECTLCHNYWILEPYYVAFLIPILAIV